MCMSKSCAENRSWWRGGAGVEDRRLASGVAWSAVVSDAGFCGGRGMRAETHNIIEENKMS